MSVQVRAALPEEYDGIAELTAEVYRDLRGGTLGEYEVQLRDVARRAAEAEVLVAVDDQGTLLGSVAFATFGSDYAEQAEPGEAVFRMLAVSPAARRRGAGEALVAACIDRARALGLVRLRLSTQAVMQDAHRLYERLGFVRTPAHDWTVRPGIDLITYALDLAAEPIAVYCDRCGTAAAGVDHSTCSQARELEPPRFCSRCGRRMTVQVMPTGWSAQCSEHGATTG